MALKAFEHKFDLYQWVYHATTDSDRGLITNIQYNLRMDSVEYEVIFGRFGADKVWCYEEELSETKIFN